MKLVEQYGTVFKLTNKAYIQMLKCIRDGKEYELGIGIGVIECRPLDMRPNEALHNLADLKQ